MKKRNLLLFASFIILVLLMVIIFFSSTSEIANPLSCYKTYVPLVDWKCDVGEEGICACDNQELKLYCGNSEEKYGLVGLKKCVGECSCREIEGGACVCIS